MAFKLVNKYKKSLEFLSNLFHKMVKMYLFMSSVCKSNEHFSYSFGHDAQSLWNGLLDNIRTAVSLSSEVQIQEMPLL